MARLSQQQIAMYAQAAGMPNPILMSAIAMAESSGNTRAHNPLGLDNSYGLWQINMLGDMGPARRRQFGISRNEELFDPAVNARAAAKILAGQGLKAWSTYTNGAYKRYMPKTDSQGNAVQAGWWDDFWDSFKDGFDTGPGPEDLFDGGMENDPSLDDIPLGDIAKGIGTIAEAVMKAAQWMAQPSNWVRVAYVLGGGVLVGAGLIIVAKPVLKNAAAAAPSGQALKRVAARAKAPAKAPAKKTPAKKESST